MDGLLLQRQVVVEPIHTRFDDWARFARADGATDSDPQKGRSRRF